LNRYYVNTITKVSAWEPPTQPATAAAAPAPAPLPTPSHGETPHEGTSPYPAPQPDHAAAATPASLATPPYPGQEHQQQQQHQQPSYFAGASPDPYAHTQSPPAQGAAGYDPASTSHLPPGAHDQPGAEGEGDRGLGKIIMGTGVGAMINTVKKDLKHGKFDLNKLLGGSSSKPHGSGKPAHAAGSTTIITEQHHYYAQSPPPPQSYQQSYQPPYQQPYQQQHQQHQQHHAPQYAGAAVAGVALGAGVGYAAGNMGHGSPPPPQQQHGHGAGAAGYYGAAPVAPMGMGMAAAGHGQLPLEILSANYGGQDVTAKARALVKNNALDLNDHGDGGVFDNWFGDPWFAVRKSLCILYRFGDRPVELLLTCSGGGTGQRIDVLEPVRPARRAFITEVGPVIAVIWGIMENRDYPAPPEVIKQISEYRSFTANNDFFQFDGFKDRDKTAVIFYRKPTGEVANIGVREGGMATL
jgi:hypothetical protein